jgi:sugar fermentation stimulation protein A
MRLTDNPLHPARFLDRPNRFTARARLEEDGRTVRAFLPDYHTDPEIARAFLEARDALSIHPVAISWRSELRLGRAARRLEIPWNFLQRAFDERGAVLGIRRLRRPIRIEGGEGGPRRLAAGHYVLVEPPPGAEDAALSEPARAVQARGEAVARLPVRAERDLRPGLTRALAHRLQRAGPELLHSPQPPLQRGDFHAVLQHYRMRRPR